MTNSTFDTEREQYTVGLIIDSLKEAFGPLIDKKIQLESQEGSEENNELIAIINLRLDTLLKIENSLLIPMQEEYRFLERSKAELKPNEIPTMILERNKKYVKAIMQGI
jgi:hypothetical protein